MAALRVRRMERGAFFKYALLLPAVIWVFAFTFLPLVSVLRYSFSSYVMGEGITGFVGFDNYIDVLESADFWHSIMVTAIYVVVSVPIELVLGFLAAWLVNLGPRGAKSFRTIIGAPLFTLEVAIGYLGVTFFTDQGGLIAVPLAALGLPIPWMSTASGGIAGAILLDVWRWTSFIFIIVLAGLAGISNDLYDAAVLDAKTTVAVLLRLVGCLKVFAIPFALTSGGPGSSTLPFSAADYLTTIQFFDFGKGSAMGIIFLILVSVVITLFFNQMRKSLS